MNEIKKIKLKEEPKQTGNELQSQGGRLRLPPTGNSSGKEYTEGANVSANAELTIGNYHWAINVSTYATASVRYIKNPDTGEYEFREGYISCGTISFSAVAGESFFEGTIDNTTGEKTGTEYTPLSTSGSLGTQLLLHIYNLSSIDSLDVPIALIGVTTTYDPHTPPYITYGRDVKNVTLSLRVGFNCNPYTGISGIALSLSV